MYLVIGSYCWGRGNTEAEAILQCAKAGSKADVKNHLVYQVCPGTSVTDDGMLQYPSEGPAPLLLKKVRGKKTEVVNQERPE